MQHACSVVLGRLAPRAPRDTLLHNPCPAPQDLSNKRRLNVPESEYKEGPEGLKFYDVIVGSGALADVGERVVVHYECKWRGVTIVTSRCVLGAGLWNSSSSSRSCCWT